MTTNFQAVSAMNVAFGNKRGNYNNIDWADVRRQCLNIFDEYLELLQALGLSKKDIDSLRSFHDIDPSTDFVNQPDVLKVRDAITDIQVFAYGAQHKMGVNGDDDMESVLEGVMSRFIRNYADYEASMIKHGEKGITLTKLEGEYPTAVLRSAADQPDAPKGKFLKSASYKEPVFTDPILAELLDRSYMASGKEARDTMLKDSKLIARGICTVVGGKPTQESFVVEHSNGRHSAFVVPYIE